MRSRSFLKAFPRRKRSILLAAALVVLGTKVTGAYLGAQKTADSGQAIDFHRDVAPIFQTYCVRCHGPEKPQGQLRLDSEAAALRGGISGRVIVPGKSAESLLVKRLLGFGDASRMPLGADPVPAEKINLIRAWIDQGSFAAAPAAAPEPVLEPEAAHPQSSGEPGLFVTRIRPILAARCYHCHGPDVQQNGLRLDSLAAALKGSASGRVITPGDSAKSPLLRRLFGLDRPQMPYGGPPLSADQIGLIRTWIDQGARGPDSAEPTIVAAKPLKHWA
jgi:mono/diheme cytochrome c family protein